MMDHGENFPKLGHVNEICKEWLVREDGALAYKLQSHEINEFYKGNKYRNAVVREDFPKALDEQIKEKELAANLNAIYREQEQQDKQYAEELARSIEKNRKDKVKDVEINEMFAKQLQDIYISNEVQKGKYSQASNFQFTNKNLDEIEHQSESLNSTFDDYNADSVDLASNFIPINSSNKRFQRYLNEATNYAEDNTQKYENINVRDNIKRYNPISHIDQYEEDIIHQSDYFDESFPNKNCHKGEEIFLEKYNYRNENESIHSQRNSNIKNDREIQKERVNLQELGLLPDEIQQIEKKLYQEKRDEELARKLQEQEQRESSLTQEEKDRLLAMEVQDKELARMLQDREKAKARKAKEKARLKRNQQKLLQNLNDDTIEIDNNNCLTTIEQESYSNPIDLIPDGRFHSKKVFGRDGIDKHSTTEEDIYALPIDTTTTSIPTMATHHDKSKSLDITETVSHIPRSDTIHGLPSLSSNSFPKSNSHLEKDTSPVPPYVPIKSTRRPSDPEGKKKKTKDKCIHQ